MVTRCHHPDRRASSSRRRDRRTRPAPRDSAGLGTAKVVGIGLGPSVGSLGQRPRPDTGPPGATRRCEGIGELNAGGRTQALRARGPAVAGRGLRRGGCAPRPRPGRVDSPHLMLLQGRLGGPDTGGNAFGCGKDARVLLLHYWRPAPASRTARRPAGTHGRLDPLLMSVTLGTSTRPGFRDRRRVGQGPNELPEPNNHRVAAGQQRRSVG